MAYNLPGITDIVASQDSKETVSNGNDLVLDNAQTDIYEIDCSDSIDIDISTGSPAILAGQAICLKLTGTLSANINLIVGAVKHAWVINDAISGASGAFTVTALCSLTSPVGLGVGFSDGDVKLVYSDGVDVITPSLTLLPGFADNETPSGTVNGSNAAFTLAHTPSPSGSLQLFKNGELMKSGGADYTLATATATFVAGAIPITGDVLLAWYRY